MNSVKFWALFLRGSSMGIKFLFLILLSKSLSVAAYGTISLIVTTVTFFIFFLGLDFYNYSHRQIIDSDLNKYQYLVNQFWFHLISYFLIAPFLFFVFKNGILPNKYAYSIFAIIVLEHLGQECFRFFNLFNKPNVANISLLIRTGLWIVLLYIIEVFVFGKEMNIHLILRYWIFGSSLSLFYSFFMAIRSSKDDLRKIPWFAFDWSWLGKGIKISMPFFLGTISYKIIEYSDRYVIDWFLGKEQVGIYSFFTNFSNIINVVINTIVVTLLVPNLLRTVKEDYLNDIVKYVGNFNREMGRTIVFLGILLCLLIFPALLWLNKEEFNKDLMTYFIILLGNIMLNLSFVYHYLLYAYKKDRAILLPSLYAALMNLVLNILFVPYFGIIAAAWSTLFSFSFILFLKRKYWLKTKPRVWKK